MDLKKFIRDVPDFPKEGILFRDITTLLKNADAFREAIAQMKRRFENQGITKVCGIESRGFIFGAPLALELGAGFVPIRKDGKLPWTKMSQEYSLEYGTDKIEIHVDAVDKGEKVLVVDDLIATGGTAKACSELLARMGAEIAGYVFMIELDFLKGRESLASDKIFSLMHY